MFDFVFSAMNIRVYFFILFLGFVMCIELLKWKIESDNWKMLTNSLFPKKIWNHFACHYKKFANVLTIWDEILQNIKLHLWCGTHFSVIQILKGCKILYVESYFYKDMQNYIKAIHYMNILKIEGNFPKNSVTILWYIF